ncbi:MAG: hypothetical protein SXV54_24825 [Chloroflexota bacterium]|nr:hypothetical protein [Chloroflexota bacterium]
MDKKASEIMGETVIAGVTLEAEGAVLKSVASAGLGGVAGAVGRVVGEKLADVALKSASLPGDHEGIHYVAVGPTKVGFFSVKRGLFKNSLDELLVQHSRSDVQTVEIESGVMPTAHFVFRDGTHYVLKCARINLGKLKEAQELLVTQ